VRQAHGVVGIARKLLEAEIGDLLAKVVAGDVFHLVGFVKHDGGIFREDAAKSSFFRARSAKKRWWLTMIRSASLARWCMAVRKHC